MLDEVIPAAAHHIECVNAEAVTGVREDYQVEILVCFHQSVNY